MKFELTQEQALLEDSVTRFLSKECSFEGRQARVKTGDCFDRKLWRSLAEMGALGAGVPEDAGGLGGSMIEVALIAEALGKRQVLEPYVGCGVFPAQLLASCQTQTHAADLLTRLLSGDSVVAVAHSERQARGNIADCATTAERTKSGYRLTGQKTLVVGARHANVLIVSARTAGKRADPAGLTLFAVKAGAPGLTFLGDRLMDWTSASDVKLNAVEVSKGDVLGPPGEGAAILQHAVDRATVALCAECVGAIDAAIELTAEYTKSRTQFRVPIASFQVLQHRMADMAIELVQARSGLACALQALQIVDPAERSARVSGAKAMITRGAHWVTSQGIQLHGGNGITEAYQVGHTFKRVLVVDALFGQMDHHLNRYAAWMVAHTKAHAAGVGA